jgi:hypothetical protein
MKNNSKCPYCKGKLGTNIVIKASFEPPYGPVVECISCIGLVVTTPDMEEFRLRPAPVKVDEGALKKAFYSQLTASKGKLVA